MVRTQIQLTEEQAERIKRIAADRQTSMAEVIRDSIDRTLASPGAAVPRQERVRRAMEAAGRFHSGSTDGAEHHDQYLAEAYRE